MSIHDDLGRLLETIGAMTDHASNLEARVRLLEERLAWLQPVSGNSEDDRLLSRSEVHSIFGLTQRYLEVSAVRGDGPPFIKVNRSVKYRVGDLREWIAAHRVTSTQHEEVA